MFQIFISVLQENYWIKYYYIYIWYYGYFRFQVRAVVAINGPPFPIANKQTYKGESFIPTIIAEPVPLEGGIRVNYEEDPEKIPNLLPVRLPAPITNDVYM